MDSDIRDLLQPVRQVALKLTPILKLFSVQSVVFHVLDSGFHTSFAFRIIAFARPDLESGRSCILGESLIELEFPESFFHNHQFRLVINTFFRTSTKVAEGLIVHPDERLRIDWFLLGGNIH